MNRESYEWNLKRTCHMPVCIQRRWFRDDRRPWTWMGPCVPIESMPLIFFSLRASAAAIHICMGRCANNWEVLSACMNWNTIVRGNKKKRVSIICIVNTASRLGKRKKDAEREYNWTNRACVNGDDRSADLFLSQRNCSWKFVIWFQKNC